MAGVVRGFVYDKANGAPLQAATVFVYGENKGAVAKENGFYVINDLDYRWFTSYLLCSLAMTPHLLK